MKRYLLSACLLLTLTACGDGTGEMDWFRYAPGGAGTSQPAPAPAQPNLSGTAATKMLTDPDATESSTEEYVWADSLDAATAMCQRTAERNGWRLDDVQLAGDIALQTGKKRYTCRWTMFGAPNHDR
jgi:hypothetical protein